MLLWLSYSDVCICRKSDNRKCSLQLWHPIARSAQWQTHPSQPCKHFLIYSVVSIFGLSLNSSWPSKKRNKIPSHWILPFLARCETRGIYHPCECDIIELGILEFNTFPFIYRHLTWYVAKIFWCWWIHVWRVISQMMMELN